MEPEIWNAPGGQDRRWKRRKRSGAASGAANAPAYLRYVVVILAGLLVGTFAWQGLQRVLHPPVKIAAGHGVTGGRPYTATDAALDSGAPAWQSDFTAALEAARASSAADNITAAEVEVDRAASIVTSAKSQGLGADPVFYLAGLKSLEQVLDTHPENERLRDHVFQARVELAQLKARGGNAASKPKSFGEGSAGGTAGGSDAEKPLFNVGPGTVAPHAVAIPGHVVFSSPRAIAAKQILNPATLGGNYLDATLMPDTSEVLLPPSTRGFQDDVRVEGLTIEGASQTLDGFSWKDVTFVGMRLRYEGGATSLKNVKFVKCTFGFKDDERGTKLIDAIVMGEGSIVLGND